MVPPNANPEPVAAGGPATQDTEDPEPVPAGADVEVDRREDLEDLDELELDPSLVPDPDGPAPKVVVFDVGEVLIDETRVWAVWAELLGVSPLTFAAVLGAAIAQGEDHGAAFPHVAPNVEWREFEDEHERRYGGFRTDDLYPDAALCLEELRELGFRIVIAGNQPRRRRDQLASLGLHYDDLVTSEELGAEKPDRGFFARLMQRLELDAPQDLLYVGDRVDNDLVPAAAFGMRICWLRRGPWGHLQDLPEDLEPDLVLEGLGELPLLLSQWRGTGGDAD